MTLVALNGCKAQKAGSNAADTVPDTQLIVNEMPVPGAQTIASAMPRAIVYRTVADYRDKVPVNIDQRTGAIVSYPDPRDLHAEAMPLPLANGYLLDRRGISPSVAFSSFTHTRPFFTVLELLRIPTRITRTSLSEGFPITVTRLFGRSGSYSV